MLFFFRLADRIERSFVISLVYLLASRLLLQGRRRDFSRFQLLGRRREKREERLGLAGAFSTAEKKKSDFFSFDFFSLSPLFFFGTSLCSPLLPPFLSFFAFLLPLPSFANHGRPVVVDGGGGHKHVRIQQQQRHGGAGQEFRGRSRRRPSPSRCSPAALPAECEFFFLFFEGECGVCFESDRRKWHAADMCLPLEVAERGANGLTRWSRVTFFSLRRRRRHRLDDDAFGNSLASLLSLFSFLCFLGSPASPYPATRDIAFPARSTLRDRR